MSVEMMKQSKYINCRPDTSQTRVGKWGKAESGLRKMEKWLCGNDNESVICVTSERNFVVLDKVHSTQLSEEQK